MRILQVGKYYPPHKGGMETALRHLTEGLLACGHEVRVLVAGNRYATRRDDLPGAPGALIRARSIGVCSSQPITFALPSLLRRELALFQPHVVHLHLPNPLACLAWRLATIPPRLPHPAQDSAGARPALAVWHHADIVRQRVGGRLLAPLLRWCLTRADGVCAGTEAWKQTSTELSVCRERVRVIPYGIDLDPFLALEPRGDGPFLFIGRLVAYKGLRVLLDALAGLQEARLDIVGTGPQWEAISKRCEQADLRGRVRLLGDVPDEDLPAIMARCRALVLPSVDRSETFGLVLVEAMAAGLPLVTTNLPTGVRELNRPGETGWLVEPGDPAGLRRALASILADPDRAMALGRNGRREAVRSYARSRLADDLTVWYRDLLEKRRGGTKLR